MARARLTYPTAAVLAAISSGSRYGFDLMEVTGLPDGTVYPILRRLESRGLLEGRWESDASARSEGRPARRYYRLTADGERAVGAAAESFPALFRLFGGGAPESTG